MRALQTHDIFKAMGVIKHLGVQDEIKKIALDMEKNKKKADQREVGIELIMRVIGNASDPKAEQSLYEFLAGPLEINPEDISTMDPVALVEKIKELSNYVDAESWKSFFKSVASLMR